MKILYCLTSAFPYGRAYAVRALNICRLLRNEGNNVYVFCDYLSDELEREEGQTIEVFEDIKIITAYNTSVRDRSLKERLTVSGYAVKQIGRFLDRNPVDLVITSSSSDRFAGVIKTVHAHNIPLIMEICEWFDSYSWNYGKADPRHWQFKRCWKRFFPQADGVLAISRLLEEQFRGKVKYVTRIPTILDIDNYEFRSEKTTDGIRLLFAGDISTGKDRLTEVIEAVNDHDYTEKIYIDIFGPDIEQVIRQSEGRIKPGMLKDEITVHGFRPQQEINAVCCEADFGLILRPDRRSSNAGFPTKLGEYLAAGTPVIANDTGDIGCYIKSGVNGFILKDIKPETISALIKRICAMSRDELSEMRKNARETAESCFNYKVYSSQLEKFAEDVKKGD